MLAGASSIPRVCQYHHQLLLILLCRSDVECDITFCGLLVMENRLKPETTPTLKILQDANIRTVMITGSIKQ